MKGFHLLLYGLLAVSLNACPFLEPPAPLAPLVQPKTQKTSYKANACKVKTYNSDPSNGRVYTYDAEGKLIKERDLGNYFGYDYSYNAAGFLVQRDVFYGEGYTFPDQTYEYNADGTLKNDPNSLAVLYRNAKLEYDAAGRVTKVTIDQGTITYKYNAAGHLIEDERKGKFCDGSSACTVLIRYDDNGNEILSQSKSDEFGTQSTETTYDTHPNPQNLLPVFKGWPAHRPLNNIVRQVTKSDSFVRNGVTYPAQQTTTTYTYTYNSLGYPVQVNYTFTSLDTFQNRTGSYSNEYESCQ